MAKKTKQRVSDIDLDREEVIVDGKRFTDAANQALSAELAKNPPVRRGPGRPPVSGIRGANTPQVAARVPTDLRDKLQARADAEGKKLSEVVRDALEAYTA
jgi:hypothetical protein